MSAAQSKVPRAPDATSPDHDRALAGLLPLWPHEIADRSAAGRQRVCQLLTAALRRERQCGVSGHWTYDLGRHAALARALAAERAHARDALAQARDPLRLAKSIRPAGEADLSRHVVT
jgi:hypothetical protein